MGKKKVSEIASEVETLEGPANELQFDLEASELLVDSWDVESIERLITNCNFKDEGRVFVGDRECAILRK